MSEGELGIERFFSEDFPETKRVTKASASYVGGRGGKYRLLTLVTFRDFCTIFGFWGGGDRCCVKHTHNRFTILFIKIFVGDRKRGVDSDLTHHSNFRDLTTCFCGVCCFRTSLITVPNCEGVTDGGAS